MSVCNACNYAIDGGCVHYWYGKAVDAERERQVLQSCLNVHTSNEYDLCVQLKQAKRERDEAQDAVKYHPSCLAVDRQLEEAVRERDEARQIVAEVADLMDNRNAACDAALARIAAAKRRWAMAEMTAQAQEVGSYD
jgi:hypothetical protein